MLEPLSLLVWAARSLTLLALAVAIRATGKPVEVFDIQSIGGFD